MMSEAELVKRRLMPSIEEMMTHVLSWNLEGDEHRRERNPFSLMFFYRCGF